VSRRVKHRQSVLSPLKVVFRAVPGGYQEPGAVEGGAPFRRTRAMQGTDRPGHFAQAERRQAAPGRGSENPGRGSTVLRVHHCFL
jgi:hypothetical protein